MLLQPALWIRCKQISTFKNEGCKTDRQTLTFYRGKSAYVIYTQLRKVRTDTNRKIKHIKHFFYLNYIYIKCNLHTWGSMLGAMGWMTSWTGSDVDVGGAFLFWSPLPGGLGMTAVAEAGYRPWLSVSWYSAACLASASFFPTTNLGNGRSLTVEIESNGFSLKWFPAIELKFTDEIIRSHSGQIW